MLGDQMVINVSLNKDVTRENKTYTCAKVKGAWYFRRPGKAAFLPSQFLLCVVSKIPSFGNMFMLSINPHLIALLKCAFSW